VIVNREGRIAFAPLLRVVEHANAQSQGHPTRRIVTIPIEINDIAAKFLIDTGSNRTIIDSAFAHRLGLKVDANAFSVVAVKGPFENEDTTTQLRVRVEMTSLPRATGTILQ
jgi:hypothetical protein